MGAKQVLLVEGTDDVHTFANLFKFHHVPNEFQIKNKEGVSKLVDELDVEILASDLKTLGIVVDADTDLPSRWQSLMGRLALSGYASLPAGPAAAGTILSAPDLPKVGIWIMPDNRLNGMLEDFIAFLIPDGDLLWEYAKKCVDAIEQENRPFAGHVSKAYIHTWLAWRERPGTPFGTAITAKCLDANDPHALLFIRWIRHLFVE